MMKKGNMIIAKNVHYCTSVWSQGIGLMFRKRLLDEAWVFTFRRAHKDWVHMWFMRFPIDIIFLDEDKKIIDIYYAATPWQLPIAFKYPTKHMIEVNVGVAKKHELKVGDKLTF